jgi:hypothetical protein
MIRSVIFLVIFLVLLLAPLTIRFLGHYRLFGGEDRRELPVYNPAEVVEAVSAPVSNEFIDEPEVNGTGFVLLDVAHGNFLEEQDITYLDSRLSLRGYQLLRYSSGDLATALRRVTAFVVIAPLERFDNDEIAAVRDFVERGGRLLLVGDPTRFNVLFSDDPFSFEYTIENDDIALNSLSNEFDIVFSGDYLYNTVENEGNFRNILINRAQMSEHDLTVELESLAFYGAHSLTVGNGGRVLLSGDENTSSSSTDRPGGLALAVMSEDEHVLAVGDVDFLSAPYYTSLDNSKFVARIADFLVASDSRRYVIQDFPFFFEPNVELVYAGSPDLGPDAFDEIIELQDAFQNANMRLTLAAAAADDQDTLYLGLYNQASDLESILSEAGITLSIDPAIVVEEEEDEISPTPTPNGADDEAADTTRQIQSALGNIQMSGTALLLLDESDGQRRVIVLAASKVGLENTIDRLLDLMPLNADYALADCLVQDNLALCPSGVLDEEVEAELDTGGAPGPIEIGDGGDDNGSNGDVDELGAIQQGTIGLDESVDGELGQDESHSWVFNEGPAIIDITVIGPDLDAVLELYDSDYELIESMDGTFSGEAEELIGVDIPDDGDYTIVVRDYFGDPSEYTLEVVTSEGGSDGAVGDASIFIFVDDDGIPSAGGISSGAVMADILDSQYEVTVWTTSIEGPLDEETLTDYNLVIWDSGDYRTEDAAFDEDALIILNHLIDGGAALIIFGTTPPLLDFTPLELVTLADIEAVGTEPILMDGIAEGTVYALDQVYDVLDVVADDFDAETDLILFEGGPESTDVGYVGVASQDDVNIFLMLTPYVALPTDLQDVLLTNIVAWMGF